MSDQPTRESRNEVFGAPGGVSAAMPTRNVMKDDFGFEIPVESVPLPSQGRVYPTDSPLHGQETIEIRAMTARDEDILTSRTLIKKGTVITELIKSCLINKDIDPDAMLSGDRNAIMTAIRVTGYGGDYSVEVDCPSCSERSKQSFMLTDLKIKRLEVEPVAEGANAFEVKVPVTKKKIRYRFLTGQDETEITVASERRKKQGMQADNLVTQKLIYSILQIDNITDKAKIQHFIRNMPARDSLTIRRHMDKNEPGIDMQAWMDCPHCLESSEVRLPMGANFFWPDTE